MDAQAQDVRDVLRLVGGGENDDLEAGADAQDRLGRAHAVAGHEGIEEQNVGIAVLDRPICIASRRALRDQHQSRPGERVGETLPVERLGIDDGHLDAIGHLGSPPRSRAAPELSRPGDCTCP